MKGLQKAIRGRQRFMEDEARFPWLSILLDAYAIIDKGVAVAVEQEEKRRKSRLACRRGCDGCCRANKDIPVYPLELVGIYWFAVEKMPLGPFRQIVKKQLLDHKSEDPCPFLAEGACSIYLLRPAACRQFGVFGAACREGEDPFHTRRHDVLTPLREYTDRAFFVMMPFYGVTGKPEMAKAVEDGLLHTRARNLQGYDWRRLAGLMDGYEKGKNPA